MNEASEFLPTIHKPEHEKIDFKLRFPASRILFCFAGAIAAWMLHLLVVYALNSLTCFWGWFVSPQGELGVGLRIIQLTASIVAIGFIAAFSLLAFKEGRSVGAMDYGIVDESVAARNPMFAFVVIASNSLLMLIIAVSLVPILMLHPCVR